MVFVTLVVLVSKDGRLPRATTHWSYCERLEEAHSLEDAAEPRRAFRKHVGMAPSAYRERFG